MSDSSLLYGRTLARCQALQVLFQAEACDRTVENVLLGEYVFSAPDSDEKELVVASNVLADGRMLKDSPLEPYAKELALGVDAHRAEIDAALESAANNWTLDRMSATDRNLLRIAAYEILYVPDVDSGVSINECIELAKAFGSSDKSFSFVNGVLGRIAKDAEGKSE